ncbi:hypothetical protein HDV00_000490, partial [Rhizophlyctis rosea]
MARHIQKADPTCTSADVDAKIRDAKDLLTSRFSGITTSNTTGKKTTTKIKVTSIIQQRRREKVRGEKGRKANKARFNRASTPEVSDGDGPTDVEMDPTVIECPLTPSDNDDEIDIFDEDSGSEKGREFSDDEPSRFSIVKVLLSSLLPSMGTTILTMSALPASSREPTPTPVSSNRKPTPAPADRQPTPTAASTNREPTPAPAD